MTTITPKQLALLKRIQADEFYTRTKAERTTMIDLFGAGLITLGEFAATVKLTAAGEAALQPPTIVKVDGSGGARCAGCGSQLDYSWSVTYSDGSHASLCSTCLPTAEPGPAASQFATSFPVAAPADAPWFERVVTEGHAAYCREHGHATYTVDGVVQDYCPRCGDNLSAPLDATRDACIFHGPSCPQWSAIREDEARTAELVDMAEAERGL